MSRRFKAKKFAKRAIGDTREKILWPRIHPETYGVAIALTDRDPSKDPESANILLLRTGYGNQRRLELPGGGAERKRIEIARMVVALAQNRFPNIYHPAPPTDEEYLKHRDSELFAETRIPTDAISWMDGMLDVYGTTSGNKDRTRVCFGHLLRVSALATQSLIEANSSTNEFDETKEMLWVPLGAANKLPVGNDTHYAVHEAVNAYLRGFEAQNPASPDVVPEL